MTKRRNREIWDERYQGEERLRRMRDSDFAPQRTAPITDLKDTPTRCLVINAEWISLIAGQVERLAFHEAWEGDFDAREDAIEKIVQILSMLGDCGLITDIRNKPGETCVLQYSHDGGLTWVGEFTLKDCIETAVQPIVDSAAQRILDELMDKYDGTAQSISENLIYDGGANDAFRDTALCAALNIFVQGLSDAELHRRAAAADIWEDVGDFLIAASIPVALFPIPGSRILAFAAAAIGGFLSGFAPIWAAVSTAALQDGDAIDAVACSMYWDLVGATPTETRFAESLDNPDFPNPSNAHFVANAIRPMIHELEIYVSFLDLWATYYDYAAGGFVTSCPCPPPEWTAQFGGTFGAPPSYSIIPNPPMSDGIWNNPNKWFYAEDLLSLPDSSNAVTVEFPASIDIHVDWVEIDIDIVNPDGGTNQTGQFLTLYDEFDVELYSVTNPGWHKDNTPATLAWEPDMTLVRKLLITARCYEPDNDRDTTTYLYIIRVHGTGTIPPEWAAFEV